MGRVGRIGGSGFGGGGGGAGTVEGPVEGINSEIAGRVEDPGRGSDELEVSSSGGRSDC